MLFNKKNEDYLPNVPIRQRTPDDTPTRSVINPGLKITGNLEGEGELQIDGHICGDIRCAQLIVGKAAIVEGNIIADEIVVRGKVNGVIRSNRVTLQQGALVQSEIFHRTLAIEEGAQFEGVVRMRDNPVDDLLAVADEMKGPEAKSKTSAAKSSIADPQPLMRAEESDAIMAAGGQAPLATNLGIASEAMAPDINSEMKRIRSQLRARRPA